MVAKFLVKLQKLTCQWVTLSATKQEAFEESIRLKNQFRTLDDDEVDFLDSVLESTRAKEEELKKETAEQLEAFKKQRENAQQASLEGGSLNEQNSAAAAVHEELWATQPSRKRRRGRERDKDQLIGSKVPRKALLGDEGVKVSATKTLPEPKPTRSEQDDPLLRGPKVDASSELQRVEVIHSPAKTPYASQAALPSLGLGAYSSDEDE